MSDQNISVQFEPASEKVQIHLPDGRVITGPRNAPVETFMQPLQTEDGPVIVGAIINGELRELTYPIKYESRVTPVTNAIADGARIYRRSLTLLLEAAFHDLYPKLSINIDHSVSFGGYFCQVIGGEVLTPEQIDALKAKMVELVEKDLKIDKQTVPLQEAIDYFKEMHEFDKVRLLKIRKKDYLIMYVINGYRDYHHGYMVPSTGYLKWFDIEPIEGGFTLRFPRRANPTKIVPLLDYPKLLSTFRQYGNWLLRLGIESVGSLNEAVWEGRIREVVLVSEALHEQRIAAIAEQITSRQDQVRVVLLAGPSCSGKTTTSRRLSIQLLAKGVQPFPLEMDNYFVDRQKTPRDTNGDFNFEHIDAIDRERLNDDVRKLIAAEEVQLPRYDFQTGKSEPGEIVRLDSGQVIILEGIHGLNPDLLAAIPNEQTFRIYVSCLTQLNLDRHNRVSTTDTRLLRRIVRDARSRGYSSQETISRWESVRRGEKRFIFPYQENADVMFNSALVYELAVLKAQAEPLLRQVPYGTPEHIEVKRLLALLEWVLPVDPSIIPDNSLLREFIGGSILHDFTLWRAAGH